MLTPGPSTRSHVWPSAVQVADLCRSLSPPLELGVGVGTQKPKGEGHSSGRLFDHSFIPGEVDPVTRPPAVVADLLVNLTCIGNKRERRLAECGKSGRRDLRAFSGAGRARGHPRGNREQRGSQQRSGDEPRMSHARRGRVVLSH